mmetsp:Transcript_36498/g.68263  ORF Transcript_36498/g.68263 Transcript_36498/m.68263 type:complete len:860 (+) Transcript_36498:70-2649(+)
MKSCALKVALLAIAMLATAESTTGAMDKVFEMLADLEAKIMAQAVEAKATFTKFSENCKSQSQEYGFEIKTGKIQIEELSATMTKETSIVTTSSTEIETISGSIAAAEQELAASIKVRKREAADFAKEEKELLETISTIERAIAVLSRAPQTIEGGASMLQVQSAGNLVQALTAMVQASMLTHADADRLTALTQVYQQETSDANDEDTAAPAGAVYESKSGGIIDVLEDLLEKAQAQLDDARKAEAKSIQDYQLLVQSFKYEIKVAKEDMSKTKVTMHKSKETFSISKGDLSVTKKDLATTIAMLQELEHDCAMTAQEYEEEMKSRTEELAAVRKATQIIKEATSFVAEDSSGAVSLMQTEQARRTSSSRSANVRAVRLVRDLARKQHSPMLSQLASRMDSVIKMSGASSADPFAKVTGMISDMIKRLEDEAGDEADHKAYCDEELGKTKAKKEAAMSDVKSMTVSLDQMKAHVIKLKEEIAELEKELAASSKAAAEAEVIRQEEHAEFEKNVAEYSKGLEGVKLALKVLRDYYAKAAKTPEPAPQTFEGGPEVLPPQPVGPGGTFEGGPGVLPPPTVGPGGIAPPTAGPLPGPGTDLPVYAGGPGGTFEGGPGVLPPPTVGPGGIAPQPVGPGGGTFEGGPDVLPPVYAGGPGGTIEGGPEVLPPDLVYAGGPGGTIDHKEPRPSDLVYAGGPGGTIEHGASMLQASPDNSGTANGIISLLEVIEADLSKGLVEFQQVEETAAAEYEEMTKALKVRTVSKQQDVKYKTKEAASIEKQIAELGSDLGNAKTELDAVLDYLDKLNEECAAKVEPYAERKARREAEIAGLKEALGILEGETALIEQKVSRRALRGVRTHQS